MKQWIKIPVKRKPKKEFTCPKCHKHYENAVPILTVGGIMCFNCWRVTK